MSSWSRAEPAPLASASASGDSAPTVFSHPDTEALSEFLSAAPRDAGAPTAEDGGTLIGSDTKVPPPDASAEASAPVAPRAPKGRVDLGETTMQPQMSSPAIERAARAQLYWSLVQRCRDKDSKILPPDAVKLVFTIDPDGYIAASSIVASAADPRHDDAALCMRRELSAATFQAPVSARGSTTRITATIPSVD